MWYQNGFCTTCGEGGSYQRREIVVSLGIIAQGFIRVTEGENMTQSVGMEALLDFGCRRRLYFNTEILCLEN